MYCKNCGSELADSAKFCTACGANVVQEFMVDSKERTQVQTPVMEQVNNSTQVTEKKNGKYYMIFGWISMVVSLLFLPIIFGAAAIILGYLYREYDRKHGTILMIAGGAGAIFGFVFGMAVGSL